MTEEKKEGSGCSSSKGCGCCSGAKIIVGLLIGAFIFASGMWFAKSHCHGGAEHQFCPFTPSSTK